MRAMILCWLFTHAEINVYETEKLTLERDSCGCGPLGVLSISSLLGLPPPGLPGLLLLPLPDKFSGLEGFCELVLLLLFVLFDGGPVDSNLE